MCPGNWGKPTPPSPALTKPSFGHLKRKVDVPRGKVREYYLQAVSNSSWANHSYLVAANIKDDAMAFSRSEPIKLD